MKNIKFFTLFSLKLDDSSSPPLSSEVSLFVFAASKSFQKVFKLFVKTIIQDFKDKGLP